MLIGVAAMSGCSSCSGHKIALPDLPYLISDSLQHFKVGDRFILATGENSCCLYCWVQDTTAQEGIATSPLINLVEIKSEEADPGCAGCSDMSYYIFECVQPGQDTLLYATIPMGSLGHWPPSCDSLRMEQLEEHLARYSFLVEE